MTKSSRLPEPLRLNRRRLILLRREAAHAPGRFISAWKYSGYRRPR